MIRAIASLLVFAGVPALAAGSPDAVLAFKERAMIDGAQIQIKHIASVQTDDPALLARLQELYVGQTPRNGLQQLVQRRQVLRTISRAQPSIAVVAEGALQTVVEAQTSDYQGARLFEAAREYLARHLRREYPELTRVEIAAVGDVADLRVPSGKLALLPRLHGDGAGKRVCVWIDVDVAGKRYRSVPVWLGVKMYAPVLVAQRPLGPRDKMDASDFVREERDIAGLRGDTAVQDFAAVVGQRARTYIAAGAVLEASDLEPAPAVLADQEVNVRVALGPVLVETKAVAEEEGYLGEYIRVRNPSSASTFTARVVGDKSVVVTKR